MYNYLLEFILINNSLCLCLVFHKISLWLIPRNYWDKENKFVKIFPNNNKSSTCKYMLPNCFPKGLHAQSKSSLRRLYGVLLILGYMSGFAQESMNLRHLNN